MVKTNTSFRKLFRRGTAVGIVFFLVVVSWTPTATAKVKSDWSKVLTVKPGTKTTVVLYTDRAPQGKTEIKGRFHSATPESITVTLKAGHTRTAQKQAVFNVLVDRPPYEGLITAGATGGIFLGWVAPKADLNARGWALFGGLLVGLPTAIAFLVSPKMKTIYNVPRKLRDDPAPKPPPTATKESSATSGTGLLLLEDELLGPDLRRSEPRRPLLREKLLTDLAPRPVHAHRSGID